MDEEIIEIMENCVTFVMIFAAIMILLGTL